ncbi:hypothetical protein ACF1BP_24655 [Streptomyces sp. NPDC014735]|uniref:hypothetical protein n=1 Tax=unclassified Streptomyces TaxID=2593676 RepID=UPI0036FE5B14
MPNAFAIITEQILRNCGEEPICAHVGNVQICTIKKHPTYQELRKQVHLGRSKSKASLRLWESVVTLAREGEQQEREKWLLIALDLLTLNLEGWSKELARKWHYEISDIRSAMTEGLLEVWSSTPGGISSNKLRDDMMTRAFVRARSLVDTGSSETCTDNVNYWIPEGSHWDDSTLRASSIIDAGTVRDPDADERIRGERVGALLQRMGAMGHAKRVHSEIRGGRRNEAHAPTITPTQVGRSWVDGKNLYYRFSDLLPQYIGFKEAANTVGLSESQASRRSGKGSAPFRVLWIGNSRAVTVKSLMHMLDIPDPVLHPDDVENGASHIGG